jgi:hypothetical protein
MVHSHHVPKSKIIRNTMSDLEDLLSSYLDTNAYDLEALKEWLNNPDSNEMGRKVRANFKRELEEAIANPGSVSCTAYKKWTGERFENQDALQKHLRHIHDFCYDNKV